MSAKIYVHPYVDGPDPDDRRKPYAGRLSWRALPGVLRQALVRLHPGIQRHCPLLFAVELVTIAFLVVTLAGLWGWLGAAVLSSVVVIDVYLLVMLLAGNLVLALGEWQRQQRAVPIPKALPRLAYRVTNYREQAVMLRVPGAADEIVRRSRACEIAAIDARDLQAGDVIVVDAGQLIPADGDILEGAAVVDEAVVTGESGVVLREAEGASEVMRDTRIVSGHILVKVARRLGHPLDWIS